MGWGRFRVELAAVCAVAALGLPACSGGDKGGGSVPTGDALSSLQDENGGVNSGYGVVARVGVISYDGADAFRVKKDVILEDVQSLRRDEGIELAEARVVFLRWRGRGMHGPDGETSPYPFGGGCTDRWPPRRFRGLYPVRGLKLTAGDGFQVAYFSRARHAGDWNLSGAVITYREGGRLLQQRTDNFRLEMYARDTEEEVAAVAAVMGGGRCHPATLQWFFGDEPSASDQS